MKRSIDQLRSQRWFAAENMRGFAHRQRTQQMGFRRAEFLSKPVVGILNTWSDMSPCHHHLRQRAEEIKRAVWMSGGFPVELPAMSLGEVMVKPTTMLYRNFLAAETEELMWSHPIDGAVLLGGCDKTTPGLLMGALMTDLPIIFCPAGPMSSGYWRGTKVGAGTHTKKYWNEYRSGRISENEWIGLEGCMTRTVGTCNTMGTASTMTSIVDAMGLTLPGASSIPAVDSAHSRMASACGERIVEMVWEDLRPSSVLSPGSFRNGIAAYMALGGSTNAVIHMLALARRAGIPLELSDFEPMAQRIPVLADLFPAGGGLMDDFYFAGGLLALLSKIRDELDTDAHTVTGQMLGEYLDRAECHDDHIIRDRAYPVVSLANGPTLRVLRGNLCPDGAIIKASSADPALKKHEGPALVFDNQAELIASIDDPALDIEPDTVLILRNAGPVGAPGMPEWGNLPIPRRLLKRGVTDLVRISDARMSGTHYGTCVLHVAPEAAVGGPLAWVRTGDRITLDVDAGTLDMQINAEEFERRQAQALPPNGSDTSAYVSMYKRHVTQADKGCDFDFYDTYRGPRQEPEIF